MEDVLAGAGRLVGGFQATLGRLLDASWAALGGFLKNLGRLLGISLAVWGAMKRYWDVLMRPA